jgi:hypothetical protein
MGGEYVGIDPSARACRSNLAMASELGFGDKVTQISSPAEDVDPSTLSGFDLCFTSPPYFTKERYAAHDDDSGSQSWARYPSEDGWRDGFLRPMLALQYSALVPGGASVLNVQDVKIGSRVHALSDWTLEAASEVGFTRSIDDEIVLQLQRRFGAVGAKAATEPVYVFRKARA